MFNIEVGKYNQKNPGKPLLYAFSADVNRDGAHIHVDAIENAEMIMPMFLSAT